LERIHPDIEAAFAELSGEKQDAPARAERMLPGTRETLG